MMNLVQVIKSIESKIKSLELEKEMEIDKVTKKYVNEINKYKDALKVNEELNEACFKCSGSGTMPWTDLMGDSTEEVCDECDGTGRKKG